MYRFPLFFILVLFSSGLFAQADIILHNGKIFTADTSKPWADAVAIQGKVIVAVGDSADVMKWKSDNTKTIDLKGKTVVPGFNDAHCHIGPEQGYHAIAFAPDMLAPTPWPMVRDSIIANVKRYQKGAWIVATINAALLEDKAVRRKQLDSIAPNQQVILRANTGHGAILNSRAMQLLGINENTRVAGGDFEKDATGKLTGLCLEYAMYNIDPKINKSLTFEAIIAGLEKTYTGMAALGVTSMQNMTTSLLPDDHLSVYLKHGYTVRVRLIPFLQANENGIVYDDWIPMLDMLYKMNAVRGLKIILDGTPIERMAAVRQAYTDKPDYYGKINFNKAELKKFLQAGIDYKQQSLVHAVGDSAIQFLFNTMLEMHPASFWKKRRVRIEHGDMLSPDQFAMAKDLGVIIVINPLHFGLPPVMNARYGNERMKTLQATKSILQYGIPVAIGSDGPADPYLNMMLSLLNPDNPAEALSLEQTITAYTMGSAYAEFMENRKGSITNGKFADIVVVSDDIFKMAPPDLMKAHSILTIIDGKIMFDKKELN
jgi:predicted amidohydrolase YtcJ